MKKILKEAKKGNMLSQRLLGNLYYRGIGVKQDFTEAMTWYRSAAMKGDSSSQFRLGLMYTVGSGVDPDPEEALRWIKKAATHGHYAAKLFLDFSDENIDAPHPGIEIPAALLP